MKPIPAIVEPAQIDVSLCEQQILVALAGERDADIAAKRHQQQADAARETGKARRLEVGRLLAKVRGAWPERGPNAKGWGEFLKRVGIAESTARMYIDEYRDPAGFAEKRRDSAKTPEQEAAADDDDERPVEVLGQERDAPPFRQLTETDLVQAIARLDPDARKRIATAARANPKGGSGEAERGTWCTSKEWAHAVGPWELDPFSNPRSHILSAVRCMLEDGGDAFGGGQPGKPPGVYLTGNAHGAQPASGAADELTRVWIQPPYELVADAIAHYGHTRFCALLRWSPDVKAWFPELWRRTAVVCHPWCERMEFEPPPGIDKSGDMPFPHALYYAHEADVTDEVRARCLVWRVDHDLDPRGERPALQLVR